MANVLTRTEDFTHADWVADDSPVRTANTQSAPSFAGASAGMADRVDDQGTNFAAVYQNKTITSDGSDWTASVYIRKDAVTTRFPELSLEFRDGGTALTVGVQLNTSTGSTANSGATGAPAASGVVDVDATWWRLWCRHANNNTGNTTIRVHVTAAIAASLGGSWSGGTTGYVDLWGANATNTSTLQAYEPDPFYAFATAALTGTGGDGMTEAEVVSGGQTIIITLTGTTWVP